MRRGVCVTPSKAQNADVGSNPAISTVRLVATAGLNGGRYEAGVFISMAPGSHTYWTNPGEAGVPPVFTFNGSENVKQADVSFPVPTRITEEGLSAFGYTGQVVFPVAVTPIDPSKPSTLQADVTYAICNKICVPGHTDAKLTLAPRGPGISPNLVTAALAQVPRPLATPEALRVSPVPAAGMPSWILTWTGATPVTDIFPDPPDGFFFSTKKTGDNAWLLTVSQSIATETATKVPVRLVLAYPNGAAETTLTFNVAPPKK